MNFLTRFFERPSQSANTAKERLQFVLAHDRSDISPETLDRLKDEVISVISKYVEIDRDHVEISISNVANIQRLVANIPVLRTAVERPKPPRRIKPKTRART
ncbi:MAG TPA: cell division topological specificity factor MinE [Anaerolineae bacterium]